MFICLNYYIYLMMFLYILYLFCYHYYQTLLMVLMLEFLMMTTLLLLVTICALFSCSEAIFVYLVFVVIESSLGLTLLMVLGKMKGNDSLQMLNLILW